MARTKLVNGKRRPLTAAEETQRDAEEAAWEPTPPETELEAIERHLTTDPLERRRIAMEARRRNVTPASIVVAILAEN